MRYIGIRVLLGFWCLAFVSSWRRYRIISSSLRQLTKMHMAEVEEASKPLYKTELPATKVSINDLIAAEGKRGLDFSGLSQNPEYFFLMREAEIKHGRIAMLAAFGWPMSELYHYQLAQSIGLEDVMGDGGRAPSVLNGGLDNSLALLALGTFFAVGAVLEFELLKRRREYPESLRNFYDMWREDGWDAPGNYGFGKEHQLMNQPLVF